MKILAPLETAFDAVIRFLAFLSGFILLGIMICVCGDVIMRYFFNAPSTWVIEVSQYLIVYVTFLGAAWVLKDDSHVKIDILILRLNPKAQAITGAISSVIGVFVCLVILWFGSVETWDIHMRGIRSPSILEFPKAPVIGIIPFGCFFFMIQFVRRTKEFMQELRRIKRDSEKTHDGAA